jgi:hypothetical protein
MRLSSAIQDYLIEIEVRKYTPKTIRGYRNNLSLFLHFCEDVAGVDAMEEVRLAYFFRFSYSNLTVICAIIIKYICYVISRIGA